MEMYVKFHNQFGRTVQHVISDAVKVSSLSKHGNDGLVGRTEWIYDSERWLSGDGGFRYIPNCDIIAAEVVTKVRTAPDLPPNYDWDI